jgi:hypothetical protein
LALDVGLLVQREDVLWVQAMPGTEHIERLVRLAMAEGLRMEAERCERGTSALFDHSPDHVGRNAALNSCAKALRAKAEELRK